MIRGVQVGAAKRRYRQFAAVNITPHAFHGDWNYTISPTSRTAKPPRKKQID
jgi:hypothetical protein